MTQIDLFQEVSPEWSGLFVLVSLAPRYYGDLVVSQTKRFEYRRGKFVDHPVTAFVYATLPKGSGDLKLPNAEIGAVAKLGKPHQGLEEVIRIKEKEDPHSRSMMEDWLKGFKTASAHPVERVIRFEKPVSLAELREKFPGFQPPQRYLILNHRQELLEFLKERSGINF